MFHGTKEVQSIQHYRYRQKVTEQVTNLTWVTDVNLAHANISSSQRSHSFHFGCIGWGRRNATGALIIT